MSESPLPWICALALIVSGCGNSAAKENATSDAEKALPQQADTAETRQAMEQLDVQWEQAANRGDAAALASLYAEDGSLLPPNSEIVQGRQNIQQTLQGLVDAGLKNVDFTAVNVGASGDLAYEIGRYSLDIQPRGAKPVTDKGKYVIVARRQSDGTWRLVADIFNTSQPAPGTRP